MVDEVSDNTTTGNAGGETNDTTTDTLVTGDQGDQTNSDQGQQAAEQPEGGDQGTVKTDDDGQQDVESYDFKLPEGVQLDQQLLDKVTPIFKDAGLNQEQAQSLVDAYSEQVESQLQSQHDSFNQLISDWQQQSKTDKDFGGDKFNENVGIAKSALEKFGTPELSQALNESGLGNHPEVIRMLVKVGRMTQEDNPGGGSPVTQERDLADKLYS